MADVDALDGFEEESVVINHGAKAMLENRRRFGVYVGAVRSDSLAGSL